LNSLHRADWLVIALYLIVTVAVGLAFRKRAAQSAQQYFLAGRSLPWWILGTSMVATTFASDTPLVVTGFIRNDGIWYNWFGWHYVISQMLAVFLFSRFWRRAEVLTDNELIELRYSGKPAAALRAFKAGYFALLYNFIVLGWVLRGIGTVAQVTLGLPPEKADLVIVVAAVAALSYALLAGFWGVVLTDVFQFLLAMFGSTVVAIAAVRAAGGMAEMKQRLIESPLFTDNTLAMVPGGELGLDSDLFKFLVFVTLMWWASHNADGGGYLIQRMCAARNERHAQGATLWYVVAHNVVRYWPWIAVGLASLVLFPRMPDGYGEEAAYAMVMREVLGPGMLGVMLVSFFAAFMSTVDTHLNWGASYLVNDLYLRFMRPAATERETVLVAKLCVVAMMVCAIVVAFYLRSIGKAWLFVWAMGAGIGPVLILRWFWWRINAWSEIAALGASLAMAFGFEVTAALQAGSQYELFATPVTVAGVALQTHHKALLLVPTSIVTWLVVTLATPPVDSGRLLAFYRRVRPGGFWGPIAAAAPQVRCDGLSWHVIGAWAAGVTGTYCLLFGLGKLLLGEPGRGWGLLLGAGLCSVVVVREMLRRDPADDQR